MPPGWLRANAAVAADLSLPVLLRHIADAARDLLRARYAAIGVNGSDGQLQQIRAGGPGRFLGLTADLDESPAGRAGNAWPAFAGPIDLVVDEALAGDVLALSPAKPSNCARHARAGIVDVSVTVAHDVLTLQITDNGCGIGIPTRSSGLTNMRLRAERHAGHLDTSEPATGGTRLTWSVALAPDH